MYINISKETILCNGQFILAGEELPEKVKKSEIKSLLERKLIGSDNIVDEAMKVLINEVEIHEQDLRDANISVPSISETVGKPSLRLCTPPEIQVHINNLRKLKPSGTTTKASSTQPKTKEELIAAIDALEIVIVDSDGDLEAPPYLEFSEKEKLDDFSVKELKKYLPAIKEVADKIEG